MIIFALFNFVNPYPNKIVLRFYETRLCRLYCRKAPHFRLKKDFIFYLNCNSERIPCSCRSLAKIPPCGTAGLASESKNRQNSLQSKNPAACCRVLQFIPRYKTSTSSLRSEPRVEDRRVAKGNSYEDGNFCLR